MSGVCVIEFERVSKQYWLGKTQTLAGIVSANMRRVFRNGQPRQSQEEERGTSRASLSAVCDMSFVVRRGESLGLIGRNGSGKTTLLKLINRVTWPTSGAVRTQGRIISLLELGAGFHGELSARDNIYLSGAIFGLTRKEVQARFDEIIEFAEIERFVDTPIKRFSSGMFARLGFSAAIHSDPDIVLVDEVLSVGDEAFQRKALDKLSALVKSGATLILVSHDMRVIQQVCQRAMWMGNGRIMALGEAGEIMARYGEQIQAEIRRNADERPWASAPGATVLSEALER